MDDLLNYLSGFVTPNRLARFEQVLDYRTRYITVVLEDIYQSQNASAVVRTCDCFGIQDVHVVENTNLFEMDREVALGADKWLTVERYGSDEENTLAAINTLRENGYRIVATTPHTSEIPLPDLNLNKGKLAIFFGTELTGISETVKTCADEFVKIPMFGFTESFNISVSVALTLQDLVSRLHKSDIEWKLNPGERDALKLQWLRKSIKDADFIEKQYLTGKN
ncbi:MAG TPA: RNA methyltransferase [Bacteroidales bacterium]|nr:RNA methyltransferase [Bacteroidales bacterium]